MTTTFTRRRQETRTIPYLMMPSAPLRHLGQPVVALYKESSMAGTFERKSYDAATTS